MKLRPLTETQIKAVITKIMALPGMKTDHDASVVMELDCEEWYFKFNSNRGVNDINNGTVFGEYLTANGCEIIQFYPVSLLARDIGIKRIFCNQ